MTWRAEVYIGEMRPWPDVVDVVKGRTGEAVEYVPGRTCRIIGTIYYDGEGVWYHELSCGHEVETLDKEPPSYCSECGARVEL